MTLQPSEWINGLSPRGRYLADVHFNISLKHDFVYCSIPKSGCTEMLLALQKAERMRLALASKPSHVHAREESPFLRLSQLPERYLSELFASEETVWFTVVRNPYTRVLSAFLDKICTPSWQRDYVHGQMNAAGRDPSLLEPTRAGFAAFLDLLKRQAPDDMDPHWRPQWAVCWPDAIPYRKIGRLESFNRDVEEIFGLLNRKHRVAYFALSGSGRPHATGSSARLAEFYDAGAAEAVREIFARDFESFGYSLDLAEANAPPDGGPSGPGPHASTGSARGLPPTSS